MKNKYVKQFFLRGLIFGGFGPIIAGIVYLCLHMSIENFSVPGREIFTAIISTYLLAFIQGGVSVFNQIESWSVGRSLLCHLSATYIAYVTCYVINAWIPFDWRVLLIFTAAFVALYMVIWLTVYLCVRHAGKRLNAQLK